MLSLLRTLLSGLLRFLPREGCLPLGRLPLAPFHSVNGSFV